MSAWRARAALIDLDGTLADTLPDLAAAVNAMRADLGRAPLPVAHVEAYVGKGADVLVHRALTDTLDQRADGALFAQGRAAFFEHYRRLNGRGAHVYPGVTDALAALRARGVARACVTNKPREFTQALLARLQLGAHFDVVVAGGDAAEKKPHPAPLLAACALLQVAPKDVVMIGDSETDLLAARAAGCRIILVAGGYNEGRPIDALAADAIVKTLSDACALLHSTAGLPQ